MAPPEGRASAIPFGSLESTARTIERALRWKAKPTVRRALSTCSIKAAMSSSTPETPRSPTLEDVARVAGVSRATVSRVINGIRNVDVEIQEAVRKAIQATGYTPNQAARCLVTRRAGTIVLVMAGAPGDAEEFAAQVFADPFFGRVAGGVVGFLRN